MGIQDNKDNQDAAGATDLTGLAESSVSEFLTDLEIETEPAQRLILAEELIEKFTSPLMIQRAAGATSQVSVIMNPGGGIESGQSSKIRNVLVNLKQAAITLPGASLPALASFLGKHGIAAAGASALGVLYLFGLLKPVADILKVPLTKQATAVLMVMWKCRYAGDDVIGYEVDDVVNYNGLLEVVNYTFDEYGWRQITADELQSILTSLERIGSIERMSPIYSIDFTEIRWRLTESVKISY